MLPVTATVTGSGSGRTGSTNSASPHVLIDSRYAKVSAHGGKKYRDHRMAMARESPSPCSAVTSEPVLLEHIPEGEEDLGEVGFLEIGLELVAGNAGAHLLFDLGDDLVEVGHGFEVEP